MRRCPAPRHAGRLRAGQPIHRIDGTSDSDIDTDLTLVRDYQLAMLAKDAPSAAPATRALLAPQLLDAEEKREWDSLATLLDAGLDAAA